MKHIWKIALVGLALSLVSFKACSLSSGPIEGQVLDETTGKPVADAIVVVRWKGDWTKIFGESSTSCYHVETARTDANGKYHIQAWSRAWTPSDLRMSGKTVYFDAYKAGYTRTRKYDGSDKPEIILVTPFRGTKKEYFNTLSQGWGCSGAGESGKNLYRLYVALAQEAKTMAETPEQEERAEFLARLAEDFLVNETKQTAYVNGRLVNVNPNDSYKKEELLK